MSNPINDNGNLESAFGFRCQALPSFQHGISKGSGSWLMLQTNFPLHGASREQGVCGLKGVACPVINMGPVWSGAPPHSCSPVPTHPSAAI